jgi:aerobic-type carbon monoxide dehydrogenase small subunit (CoxS/CutS family)
MSTEKNTILITLVYQDQQYQVQTRKNQYHSLMTLIVDHLALPEFGLCCGMGSCGTCMVQINEKYSPIEQFVLSCDVLLNEALSNTTIIIPKRNY